LVDRAALATRLDALGSYLAELRRLRDLGRARFLAEPSIHHLAERYLHLACECILDIAHHLIADQGFRQANSYRDALEVLKEEGVLEPGLADRLKLWMGLRNVLVHFYLTIDHDRIFDAMTADLDDLEAFSRALGRFLA
jgi:uncharacterized protein YutE (UPF0331/DUF86 family)